ncbi:hypothetical protein LCGC14_2785750 [marine sediment metagenome]|uniref:Uncharacterized protein n=1 Tax=marine sediment metagenome TaxID=412755 RepID=A0A0F9B0K4_9ZZZZ
METQQVLIRFDWRAYEVEVVTLKPCCTVRGRPVCILRLRVSSLLCPAVEFEQPFYRSSGKNSGLPDVWLPFRGIDGIKKWFNKGYRKPLESQPLWEAIRTESKDGRWGHPIYKVISDFLAEHDGFVAELPIEDDILKASALCPLLDGVMGWD